MRLWLKRPAEVAQKQKSDTGSLVEKALSGNRLAIAKLISIVEDGAPELAEVMGAVFPHSGAAYTIGITGAPGAGKSTLTEGLIGQIRAEGKSVAVLAIDPSSPFTGGALLGDRVRMQSHATDGGVFIRSMATRGHLGGLALATPEAVRILDAAGTDYVVIETVGVGQDEVAIVESADTTVVILNPGWGDSVQAAKAGLLEIGDIFAVNKADREGLKQTVRELNQMIDFGPHRKWRPPIIETIATEGKRIGELWAAVKAHQAYLTKEGELEERRRFRIAREISDIVAERVRGRLRRDSEAALEELAGRVVQREIDPYAAAEIVMDKLGIEK